MKHFATIILLSFMAPATFATDYFWDEISEVGRYDLADAYMQVGERYLELNEKDKADVFIKMAEVLYPGFETFEVPSKGNASEMPARPSEPMIMDDEGEKAVQYYWEKLIRGVFSENVSLTESVIADRFYLPYKDQGYSKTELHEELLWLFERYAISSIDPEDLYLMDTVTVAPLNKGYWVLAVDIDDDYLDVFPDFPYWSKKQNYYFQKFPEGWRLVAIGNG